MKVIYKTCNHCKQIKSLTEFHNNKNYKDCCSPRCKSCCLEYRKTNKEKLYKYDAVYRKNNVEKIKIQQKKYYYKNKDKRNKNACEWTKKNIEHVNAQRRQRYSSQKQNPTFQLANNIRGAIRKALKRNKNWQHWEYLLGYTKEDLKTHLEKQFKDDMTWENYGQYGWHVDHIIPRSLWEFKSYNDREFKQCWALCNLQPLWAKENMSKGNKII